MLQKGWVGLTHACHVLASVLQQYKNLDTLGHGLHAIHESSLEYSVLNLRSK